MFQKSIKLTITLGLLFVISSFLVANFAKVFTAKYEKEQVNLLLDEISENKTKEDTAGVLVADKRDVAKAVMNLNREDMPEIVEVYKSTIDAEIASALYNNIQMKKEKSIKSTITYRGGSFYEERSINSNLNMESDCEIVKSVDDVTMIGKKVKVSRATAFEYGFVLFNEAEELFLQELLLNTCEKSQNGNSNVYSWTTNNIPLITTLKVDEEYGLPVQQTGTLKISTYNGEIQSIDQTCKIKFENGITIIGTSSTVFSDVN